MIDEIMFYITMRREQLRYEIERGEQMDYPPYRWGLIEGEKEALNEIERIINGKNREVGR